MLNVLLRSFNCILHWIPEIMCLILDSSDIFYTKMPICAIPRLTLIVHHYLLEWSEFVSACMWRKRWVFRIFFIGMTYDRSHHLLNINQPFGFFRRHFFRMKVATASVVRGIQYPLVVRQTCRQPGRWTDRQTDGRTCLPAVKEPRVQSNNKKYLYTLLLPLQILLSSLLRFS